MPTDHIIFEHDYHLNGQVLYPAGVPVEATEHTLQLLADGVAGHVVDAEKSAQH